MADESKTKECAFFVVRYVPDLVRDEALNIGLFLYSPEEKYLGCVFTDDFRRVKRLHPQADLEFLHELQQDFEQQIEEHGDDLEGYIRLMQESFSNLIQVTPPRLCLLNDPQSEMQGLFGRYVGERLSGPPPEDTRLRIKQRLTSALVRAGVWEHLEKRVPVEGWTKKGDPFTFDYGYRPLLVAGKPDGHLRFMHAVSLKRDTQLAKALAYTMDCVRAKERAADLTAVVESLAGPGEKVAQASQKILYDASISIQALSGVDDYAQSVRRELLM